MQWRKSLAVGLIAVAGVWTGGCESTRGDEEAAVPRESVADTRQVREQVNQAIGKLFTAGEGMIIGAQADRRTEDEARHAAVTARQAPTTAAQARQSATADLNKDGFVTTDELVAMHDAGLNDEEILKRLTASGQVFRVTSNQRRLLTAKGVSRTVLDKLGSINHEKYVEPASSQR